MEPPHYPEFWQCIGMIVGVYGIGYLIAASDPIRHWPIVFVGFLGKVLGPIGFAEALWSERLPLAFGLNIVTNDLIWWLPFSLILLTAWKARGHSKTSQSSREHDVVVVGAGIAGLMASRPSFKSRLPGSRFRESSWSWWPNGNPQDW